MKMEKDKYFAPVAHDGLIKLKSIKWVEFKNTFTLKNCNLYSVKTKLKNTTVWVTLLLAAITIASCSKQSVCHQCQLAAQMGRPVIDTTICGQMPTKLVDRNGNDLAFYCKP